MSRTGVLILTMGIGLPVLALTVIARSGSSLFEHEYDTAVAMADADSRLLVVDFTATWCGPCKLMDRTTWRDASVRDWIDEHAVATQVDVDERSALAREFGVHAMPTVIAIRSGREVDRVVGYRSADDLLVWLEAADSGQTQLDVLREHALDDDGGPDLDGILSLVRALSQPGEQAEASIYLAWLWNHAADDEPEWRTEHRSELAAEIAQLADRHAPTREAFMDIFAGHERVIRNGQADADTWRDVIELGTRLDLVERIDVCIRESVESGRALPDLPVKTKRRLFDALVAADHHAEAAAIGMDLEYRARVMVWDHRSAVARSAKVMPDWLSVLPAGAERGRLRTDLAQLSLVALVDGQDDLAETIGAKLLSVDDGPAARIALVTQALEYGQPRSFHEQWLLEAPDVDPDSPVQRRLDRLAESVQAALADGPGS